MLISKILLAIAGLAAGGIVASCVVAVFIMLGVIPRLAGLTKTAKYLMTYENFFIGGTIIGNLLSFYKVNIPIGTIGLILFGCFSGIYVGCMSVALAEVVKTVPIMSRRLNIRKGLPYFVIALALGKLIGTFVQYFIF